MIYEIKNAIPLTKKLFTFYFSLLFFTSCKTVLFKNYFPVEKNKQIVYLSRIDSTNFEQYDTLICRKVTAKQTRNVRANVLNISMADRQTNIVGELSLYYFEKLKLDSNEKIWIHDKSFAERIYCFTKDGMYVNFGWDKAMSYDTELDLLFSNKIKKGIFYKHKNGDYCKAFQFIGKENVVLNDKTYRNCIKIDIFETLGKTTKIGTAWFAKNMGLIKWTKLNESVAFIKP